MKNQSNLVAHCGGEVVPYEALADFAIPEKTKSYEPVTHQSLIENIRTAGAELLRRPVIKETFAVTREGQRFFGLITFANGQDTEDLVKCVDCDGAGCPTCNSTGWLPEAGVSIGIRNSYDMSMSIGVALGFRVFVCDNLAFSGEIHVMRKHTKNVWENLDQILVHTLFRKGPGLVNQFREDAATLKGSVMERMAGFEFMGRMYGEKILTPNQLSVAAGFWEYECKQAQAIEHQANAWQLYNSITQGLKSTPPNKIMEKHKALHGQLLTYAG